MQESAGHIWGDADRAFTAHIYSPQGFPTAQSHLLHRDDIGEQLMASKLDRVSFAQLHALLSKRRMWTEHKQYPSFFHVVQSKNHELISAVPAISSGQAQLQQVISFNRQVSARNSGHTTVPALFVQALSMCVLCSRARHLPGYTFRASPSLCLLLGRKEGRHKDLRSACCPCFADEQFHPQNLHWK